MAELDPIAYLDTSALVKLVVPEPESEALRQELRRWPRRAASALARAELTRACRRIDATAASSARQVLEGLSLIAVSDSLLEQAARTDPPTLRTLAAIHLATARALSDALGVLFTYDGRLAMAARDARLPVASPS